MVKAIVRLPSKFGAGRAAALALLVALILLRIWDPAPLAELRNRSFDIFQVLQPRKAQKLPVVIVDIDEESLKTEGQWPWPRTMIADLVNRLTKLGAIVVGFDVVFAEPDRYSPATIINIVHGLDPQTRDRIKALPSNDQVLARAFREGRVVVGESGVRQLRTGTTTPPPQVSLATIGPDPSQYLITFPALLSNIPILDNAAAGRGLFTIRTERDGIVRRVPMVMRVGNVIVPSLSLEMLRAASGAGPIIIRTDQAGIHSVGVHGFELPTDRNGQIWVHFSPHDPRRYVSARDVLAGRISPEKIDHKLVLIGTSAIGLLDRQTTPVDPSMPGVEVHAQILENALTGSWISYPDYAIAIELTAAVLESAVIIILVPVLGAGTVAVLGAAAAASLVGSSWYLYTHFRMLFDVTFALLATFAVYLVLVFMNYFREEAQRQRIRAAFRHYLSPALVEQLANAPEKLVLGGEEREMTIMFSDVRGFTSISETYKNDPQGLTTLMNRLLTPLTNAIIDHKGTIDKYMGDAIMAFWNAPLADQDHAINACESALEMHARLKILNHDRALEAQASGQPMTPIRIGVGVNTGICVVGNMGSDLRFDYSALGDVVNLTSRIEGQTKTYGVPIIAGSKTMEYARERFATLELDRIRVKGKTEPEIIYGIFGAADLAASDTFCQLRDLNNQLLTCYRRRDWPKALEVLNLCRVLERQFDLATFFDLYASRILAYRVNPPPDDWDGVYVATEK
jgi:adenylate cyclase